MPEKSALKLTNIIPDFIIHGHKLSRIWHGMVLDILEFSTFELMWLVTAYLTSYFLHPCDFHSFINIFLPTLSDIIITDITCTLEALA